MSKDDFKIQLKSYNEMFVPSEVREENKLPKIRDIKISEIDSFPNRPFKVVNDEEMEKLVESIRDNGQITPVILRKVNDRYQMISGHRRLNACKLLGYETIKASVIEASDDEAIVMMVEANYQRSTIKPSEKAFAYKMRLAALNRQGKRTDLTFSQVGTKLNSIDEISQSSNDSKTQIYRYVKLTSLNEELLDMVDSEKIKLIPAVELSYLDNESQTALLEIIKQSNVYPSNAQAKRLHELSKNGKLSKSQIEAVLKKAVAAKTIDIKHLDKYIPKEVAADKKEAYIIQALKYYNGKIME